ncbi:TetR/AcrR family transcriptional regulator [Streptomyces pactum]|uniref:TetR/AcrR family transcriptional regulator n=1 Tax=Streptomyces pactum TaxID=68249 RepID=UPI003701707A
MASVGRAGRTHSSVWLSDRPAARRRPDPEQGTGTGHGRDQAAGLDRDRIVAVTVRLLDDEGLAKFSMRRLAAELGVTAMSVYWYVDTKDDLLELALDQVHGEVVLPETVPAADGGALSGPAPDAGGPAGTPNPADTADPAEAPVGAEGDWRAQLRQIAVEYRSLLVRHPWVTQLIGRYLNVGPRSLAISSATLRVVVRSGLPADQRTGALSAVFQFVYGFATIEGLLRARCREAGVSMDDYFRDVLRTVEARPEFQETLLAANQFEEMRSGRTIEERHDRDFAFALDTVIAGIEAMRDRPR